MQTVGPKTNVVNTLREAKPHRGNGPPGTSNPGRENMFEKQGKGQNVINKPKVSRQMYTLTGDLDAI